MGCLEINTMISNLVRLRELTETLSDFIPAKIESRAEIHIPLNSGKTGKLIGLYQASGEASIALSINPVGSEVSPHAHIQTEIFVILSGEVIVSLPTGIRHLLKSDYIAIQSNIPHSVKFLQDTKLIAITIPDHEGFPDAVSR